METDGTDGGNKRWDGRGTMRGCACARARERGGNYEMGGGRKDMISSYSSSLSCSRLMSSLCTVEFVSKHATRQGSTIHTVELEELRVKWWCNGLVVRVMLQAEVNVKERKIAAKHARKPLDTGVQVPARL